MTRITETCYVCHGTGTRRFGLRDGDSVKCKTCGGTGRIVLVDHRKESNT